MHPDFKWNGKNLTAHDLLQLACIFIKEGRSFEVEIGEFLLDWLDNSPNISVQTSGTTGMPKMLQISKNAMVQSALATGAFFDLRPKHTALCCLPVRYIAGKMMLVRAFVLGLEIDVVEANSFPLAQANKKYDFVAMVPLQVENSLPKLALCRILLVGGAKIATSLKNELLAKKLAIFETYGMTETLTHIAVKRIEEAFFRVLPDVIISTNELGCLCIDAPKIASETIVTNDLVHIINDQQFEFLGRVDNVINSGGIKLIPEQIEAKLSEKMLFPFFVAGVLDEKLGEKLVLVVEDYLKKPMLADDFTGLKNYEKPKETYFLDAFIYTDNGKIKRKDCLQLLGF